MAEAWALELSFLASVSNLGVISEIYNPKHWWADLLSANTSYSSRISELQFRWRDQSSKIRWEVVEDTQVSAPVLHTTHTHTCIYSTFLSLVISFVLTCNRQFLTIVFSDLISKALKAMKLFYCLRHHSGFNLNVTPYFQRLGHKNNTRDCLKRTVAEPFSSLDLQ